MTIARHITVGLVWLLATTLHADIIVDGARLVSGLPPSDLLVAPRGVGIFVTDQGAGIYEFRFGLIANEYRLYAADPLLEFDRLYADTQTPIVSNSGIHPGSSLQTFLPGQQRFYSYWADVDIGGVVGPDDTDDYGWVLLTYTGTELEVSGSATAIDSGGIIVGTYTQIPEPATTMLVCIGGITVWLVRKHPVLRRRKANKYLPRTPSCLGSR